MMSSDSEPDIEGDNDEVETNAQSIKAGWLSKQGGSHKNIKKRWFVLTKTSLKYFKNEKLGKALGVIYVRRATEIRKLDDLKSFEIVTPERVYVIIATTPGEMDSWIDAIKPLIPSGAAREAAAAVVKSGYLTKQGGGFKSWKKRWFVLTKDNLLSYYHEQGDVVPLGTIDLEKCSDVKAHIDSKNFSFDIITPERTYVIMASSKDDLESWMHKLLEIVGNVVDGVSTLKIADDDDDVIMSQDELSNFIRMDTKITKEGYLVKQGGKIKTWKKRWFVLRESTLAYYKDDKDDKPLGLISLKDCKSFELASQKVNKPYAFEIATPDRDYICCAKDEDEMWAWINVLSTAVQKAGGKETFEFIALKKASELAEKKRMLQLQVYRKATAKNFRRKISRYRNNMNKQPITPRKAEDSKWTRQVKGNSGDEERPSRDLQAEEDKILDHLDNVDDQKTKKDLNSSIMKMEKDIATLNKELKSKSEKSDLEPFDELDDEILQEVRKREKNEIICYARAIMDFNPNAYDDEALGFLKGDLLIVEDKAESGNWRGRLVKKTVAVAEGKAFEYSKSGTFPYRYVEEIDEPDEFATTPTGGEKPSVSNGKDKGGWNDQLDSAVETLFEMYDSDGDGFMTKLDFFEFLYEFGKTFLTDKQVDRCWETLDSKKLGKVDAPNFREGIRLLDSLDFYADWTG